MDTRKKSSSKPRNYELAVVLKNDCRRFRIRVVADKKKKAARKTIKQKVSKENWQ